MLLNEMPIRKHEVDENSCRIDLAACYRLMDHFGWSDLVYTHVSARVPGSEQHFLINPFGLLFGEVTAADLVKVDLDGNLVDPGQRQILKAGFVIHSAVHAARPDAHCVLHAHTRAGMAFSCLEEELLPMTQHGMMFHGKVAYHESEGFAVNDDERRRIAADLGTKPIMILRNHGTLVAGATIAEAFSMMWHLEKAMQAQLDARAAGRPIHLPPPHVPAQIASVAFAPQTAGNAFPDRVEWPALTRMLDRRDPSYRQL